MDAQPESQLADSEEQNIFEIAVVALLRVMVSKCLKINTFCTRVVLVLLRP